MTVDVAASLPEAAYRAVVEGSPIATLLISRQGEITFVNTQLEHLFGYASGELIGKQLEILVPAAIRKNHPELRDSYFDKPMPRYMGVGRDLSGTRKDGSDLDMRPPMFGGSSVNSRRPALSSS